MELAQFQWNWVNEFEFDGTTKYKRVETGRRKKHIQKAISMCHHLTIEQLHSSHVLLMLLSLQLQNFSLSQCCWLMVLLCEVNGKTQERKIEENSVSALVCLCVFLYHYFEIGKVERKTMCASKLLKFLFAFVHTSQVHTIFLGTLFP